MLDFSSLRTEQGTCLLWLCRIRKFGKLAVVRRLDIYSFTKKHSKFTSTGQNFFFFFWFVSASLWASSPTATPHYTEQSNEQLWVLCKEQTCQSLGCGCFCIFCIPKLCILLMMIFYKLYTQSMVAVSKCVQVKDYLFVYFGAIPGNIQGHAWGFFFFLGDQAELGIQIRPPAYKAYAQPVSIFQLQILHVFFFF